MWAILIWLTLMPFGPNEAPTTSEPCRLRIVIATGQVNCEDLSCEGDCAKLELVFGQTTYTTCQCAEDDTYADVCKGKARTVNSVTHLECTPIGTCTDCQFALDASYRWCDC